MGNKTSFSDKWIELYNTKDTLVNLDGWTLKSSNEKINIELMGQIRPKSYFLLERTNDDTVPSIKADQIYTGALDNGGNHLILSYNNAAIDEINCPNGWWAGDNKTKQTMAKEMKDWHNSQNPESTPKSENDYETPETKIKQEEIKEKIKINKLENIPTEFQQQFPTSFFHLAVASLLSFPLGIAMVFLKREIKG